ncbi:5210_t:CDS:2 [Entrophospora sp. SA101]|nr:340_t:CDS:2 [Entrophospora sp. SA101]CAJ0765103.1 5210_t:CDS:2 [Entrophospora sp. SA101]
MGCEDNGGNGKANNCKFNDVKWSSISSSVGIGEASVNLGAIFSMTSD